MPTLGHDMTAQQRAEFKRRTDAWVRHFIANGCTSAPDRRKRIAMGKARRGLVPPGGTR